MVSFFVSSTMCYQHSYTQEALGTGLYTLQKKKWYSQLCPSAGPQKPSLLGEVNWPTETQSSENAGMEELHPSVKKKIVGEPGLSLRSTAESSWLMGILGLIGYGIWV